jgi:hypothetical protein
MTAKCSLGDTALIAQITQLGTRRPTFEEPLSYQVRSPVSVETFQIFVTAFEARLLPF